MIFFLAVLLVISLAANGVQGVVVYRSVRRLFQYDDVFQYLSDDIQTNLRQFARIATSPMLANDAEVVTAHRNMLIMGQRLEEILQRVEEATGLNLRPPPVGPRPVVA